MILNGFSGQADPDLDRLFEDGNTAYQAENYTEAIRIYESIIARGYESGELYFNLGNAWYRTGNIGKTILYYERAARRRPNDPNIAYNLQLANLSVKDRIEVPPEFFLFRWYWRLVNLNSARAWAFTFSLLLILAVTGMAVLLNLELRRLRRLFKVMSIIAGVLCLLSLGLFIQKYQHETADDQGVIISAAVSSLAAPQAGSTELFIVHEGTKVKILDEDENWLKVELIDGKQGWLPATDIAKI
jgi:tetratricopeptide (TPR) repeat protein